MRFGLSPRLLRCSGRNLTLGSRSAARIRPDAVFRARLRAHDICACCRIVVGNRSLANITAPTREAGQDQPPRLLEKSLPGGRGQAMHAHFVLAHPEPQSFNAHLVRSGSAALEAEGWTTSVS